MAFTILAIHLKSRRPIIPEDADPHDQQVVAAGRARALMQRAAEAVALRCILLRLVQEACSPVIVLGDFNDSAHAVTNTIICGAPPWRYTPPDDPDATPAPGASPDLTLYNALEVQAHPDPTSRRHTHRYKGVANSLDHIFLSDHFVGANPVHLASVEKVQVYSDHLPPLDDMAGPPDWQSDHGQVAVTFAAKARK